MQGMLMWWPWTPAWLEAIATVIAAVAAVAALAFSVAALRGGREQLRELQREAEERHEADLAQYASRVALHFRTERRPLMPGRSPLLQITAKEAVVRNFGEMPVHDLWVRYRSGAETGPFHITAALQLIGGEEIATSLSEQSGVWPEDPSDLAGWFVDFTDPRGQRWRRFGDGRLQKAVLTEWPPPDWI